MRRAPAILLVALLSILAAGCGGSSNKASDTTATTTAASCDKGSLNLVNAGQLTVGTDNPAFPPWFGGGREGTVEGERSVLRRGLRERRRLRRREASSASRKPR